MFLDEFPEFGTRVLEVMRQPMEDKVVTINHATSPVTFSANSQLIAAMTQLNLPARAYHRIPKLAGTIADFAGRDDIQSVRLAAILQYQRKIPMGKFEFDLLFR